MHTPPTIPTENGQHFTAGHLGRFEELTRYIFSAPVLGERKIPGKIFLKDALGLTGVEMSWNYFPPGAAMPFLHAHHQHEEVYLFIRGQGEFLIDGTVFPVGEGSVVRVSPRGARAYRNVGDEPLHFIVLQVKQDSLSAGTIEDGYILETPLHWPETQTA